MKYVANNISIQLTITERVLAYMSNSIKNYVLLAELNLFKLSFS